MNPDSVEKVVILLAIIVGSYVFGLFWWWLLGCRKQEKVTPVTKQGLEQYDDLPPGAAILLAWTEAGANPQWHREMQNEVRKTMPVLARALDRFIQNNS